MKWKNILTNQKITKTLKEEKAKQIKDVTTLAES